MRRKHGQKPYLQHAANAHVTILGCILAPQALPASYRRIAPTLTQRPPITRARRGVSCLFRRAPLLKTVALAVTLALVLPGAAAAATVINGGFEADAGRAQDGQFFSTMAGSSGNNSWSVFSTLPGWTRVAGTGVEVQTARTLNTIDPHGGSHYVELDGNNNSALQQMLTLGAGRYLLSFWYSPRDSRTASNGIAYSVGSLVSGSITGPAPATGTTPLTRVGLWTEVTALFDVSTSGSYALSFAATGTSNGYGGFIDDVSLTAVPLPAAVSASIAAVPLPAGGLLLAAGIGVLAALRRRRARAA